jgi:hypothetical protein
MTIEQRLTGALRGLDQLEPSVDLWDRVVHSIDEDRAHRRRVIGSVAVALLVLAALGGAAALSLRDGPFGIHVARPVMEAIEFVGLVVVVAVLGPVIRRFGRHFAEDLFVADRTIATALLRLLDVAYFLVFAAYVLMTTQFEFEVGVARRPASLDLAQQLHEAAIRFGGLLLLMGVLHALTIAALPFVALVHNSTRRHRPLPPWLRIAGMIAIVVVGLQLVGAVLALLLAGLD